MLNRELGSTSRNYQHLARQFDRLFRRHLYRAGRDSITKQDYVEFEKLAGSMTDRPSTDTISYEMGPSYSKFMMRWLKEIKAKEYEVNNQMRKIEDRLHRQVEREEEKSKPSTAVKGRSGADSRREDPEEEAPHDSEEEVEVAEDLEDMREEESRRVERIEIGAKNPELDDSYMEEPAEEENDPQRGRTEDRLKQDLLAGLSEEERNREENREAGQEEMDLDAEGDEYEEQNLTNPDDIQQLVDDMPSKNDIKLDKQQKDPLQAEAKTHFVSPISLPPNKKTPDSHNTSKASLSKEQEKPPSKKESSRSRPNKEGDSSIKLKPHDDSFEQRQDQTFTKKDKPSLDDQRQAKGQASAQSESSRGEAKEPPSSISSTRKAAQPTPAPIQSKPQLLSEGDNGPVLPSKRPEIKLIMPGGAMPPKPSRQDESSFISDD